MNKGLFYGLSVYILWGILPIYWKALQSIPALEILSHRTAWSLLVITLLLLFRQRWAWVGPALKNRKTILTFFTAATLLALNWFTYIWAVNAGYIIEASLGYFINPLVNILLGFIFLGERLRLGQGVAIAFAALGVLYLTINYGSLPWIALTLAFTFGFYGLLKKKTTLQALDGLFLETALLFLPALGYLIYLEVIGAGAFGHTTFSLNLLLILTGLATALPLLLFAAAAQAIPLSTIGLLQYISPTLGFLLGVFVYQEALSTARLTGFSLIWLALVIYSLEGVVNRRKAALRLQYTKPN